MYELLEMIGENSRQVIRFATPRKRLAEAGIRFVTVCKVLHRDILSSLVDLGSDLTLRFRAVAAHLPVRELHQHFVAVVSLGEVSVTSFE